MTLVWGGDAAADGDPAERQADDQAQAEPRPVVPARSGWTARRISLATIALLLAAWALASALQPVSPVFMPSPLAVARKFVVVWNDGFVDATLLAHLGANLGRVFAALVAATLVGIPVGIAIGTSEVGRGIFDPLLEFLRLAASSPTWIFRPSPRGARRPWGSAWRTGRGRLRRWWPPTRSWNSTASPASAFHCASSRRSPAAARLHRGSGQYRPSSPD